MKKGHSNKNIITYASPFMIVGLLITVILGYTIFLFLTFYKPAFEQIKYGLYIIMCFFTVIPATIIFVLTAYRGLLRIEFNEFGIEAALFHVFHKRKFSWDEIMEICYCERLIPFIFISKAKTLKGMSYNKIVKSKDVITIQLSRKLYKAIKQFTNIPIENVPDKIIKQLEK